MTHLITFLLTIRCINDLIMGIPLIIALALTVSLILVLPVNAVSSSSNNYNPTRSVDIKQTTPYLILNGAKCNDELLKCISEKKWFEIGNISKSTEKVKFIEATFRIMNASKSDDHAGIIWNDGQLTYYAFIRPYRLGIVTLPTSTLSEDTGVNNTVPVSYSTNRMLDMKVEFSNTDPRTTIFVNGIPRLFYPEILNTDVTKIGLLSYNSVTQLGSLKVGLTTAQFKSAAISNTPARPPIGLILGSN